MSGPWSPSVPGLHNVKNSLAAIAAARELEISFPVAARALEEFLGVIRRFERKGERRGVLVIDDYAQLPTESLPRRPAARQARSGPASVVLFQPHLYSRTRDFAPAFREAAVPGGRRPPSSRPGLRLRAKLIEGGRADALVAGRGDEAGPAVVHGSWRQSEAIPKALEEELKEGNLLITMGERVTF